MPHPFFLIVPLAIVEVVTYYWWHWPHRELLPERFRTLLLAKGVLKALGAVALTLVCYLISPVLGWVYAMGHLLLGVALHFRWCRRHGVDPIRVEPRDQYVAATASWVEKLIAAEATRRKQC